MRTRRQQRYVIYIDSGFFPFEANPLSKIPIRTVPYMKGMIRERRDLYRLALQRKTTYPQFKAQIRELYIIKGFTKIDWRGKKVADPWAFVRDFEDRYKAKHPAYESPWLKRRRSWGDFMAKIEKTIAAQHRLRERTA